LQQFAEAASARQPRGVVVGVRGHQTARAQGADHGAEHAPLFIALESRPRQAAQHAIRRGMAETPQMFVETLGGIVDDLDARKMPLEMFRKLGINFNGEKKCGRRNFLLNQASERAGAGAYLDNDFGFVQPDTFNDAFREPGGTRHDGARERGRL